MGIYINPLKGTKEAWLSNHAIETRHEQAFRDHEPGDRGLIGLVWVDNDGSAKATITTDNNRGESETSEIDMGRFTAVAVVDTKAEAARFTQSIDPRPRKLFYAPLTSVLAPEAGLHPGAIETLSKLKKENTDGRPL